jgi:hypothetical protein
MTPFEGGNVTEDEALFNKMTSKARVSVELAFKGVKKYFSQIAFPRRYTCREHRVALGIWRAGCSGILDAA